MINIFGKRKGESTTGSDPLVAILSIILMVMVLILTSITSFFADYGVKGTVYADLLYKDPTTENILINYMDITTGFFTESGEDKYRVGDLITLAVWKGTIEYEYDGHDIDLDKISTEVLIDISSNFPRKLTLVMDEDEIILDEIKGAYTAKAIILIKAGEKEGELILER